MARPQRPRHREGGLADDRTVEAEAPRRKPRPGASLAEVLAPPSEGGAGRSVAHRDLVAGAAERSTSVASQGAVKRGVAVCAVASRGAGVVSRQGVHSSGVAGRGAAKRRAADRPRCRRRHCWRPQQWRR